MTRAKPRPIDCLVWRVFKALVFDLAAGPVPLANDYTGEPVGRLTITQWYIESQIGIRRSTSETDSGTWCRTHQRADFVTLR